MGAYERQWAGMHSLFILEAIAWFFFQSQPAFLSNFYLLNNVFLINNQCRNEWPQKYVDNYV